MKKLLVFLTVLIALVVPVSASTKTAAKKAYEKFMGEHDVVYYAQIYFDDDSVPELLIDEMGIPSLYTYKNGKVTAYGNSTVDRHFEVIGYYKKAGCLVQRYIENGEEQRSIMTTFWTKNGTAIYNKLQMREISRDSGEQMVYTYNKTKSTDPYMGKKILKEKSFNKKLKTITQGKNRTKIKWKQHKAPKLNINMTSANIEVGDTVQLKVSGGSGTVKWSTDDKSVATVSSNGLVKGKNPGTVLITAVAGGASANCVVTVAEEEIKEYYHEDERSTIYIGTIDNSYGGPVNSVTASSNLLTVYGGVAYPDAEDEDRFLRKFYGINRFYLTPDTKYSYEDNYSSGYVSKNVFMAYYLEDFLDGKNDLHFLFIRVENGVVQEVTVSIFEPQIA